MENRHLCRAKRLDNGEWSKGFYVQLITEKGEKHYIYTGIIDATGLYPIAYKDEIDPSTLCQCAGLTDSNGRLIWENDILTCEWEDEDSYFVVKLDNDSARFECEGDTTVFDFDNYRGTECEVIGNIFDNSELLEGGHE